MKSYNHSTQKKDMLPLLLQVPEKYSNILNNVMVQKN